MAKKVTYIPNIEAARDVNKLDKLIMEVKRALNRNKKTILRNISGV